MKMMAEGRYGRHERRQPTPHPRTLLHGPLHRAVHSHQRLKELLSSGEHSVDARGLHNFTPLICAACGGHVDAIKLLVDAGADLTATDVNGSTALHRAAFHGKEQAIYLLLDLGASLEATDRYGRTPLHAAADNGQVEAANALLKRGASTYSKDGPLLDGDSPLEVAQASFEKRTTELLQVTASPLPPTLKDYTSQTRVSSSHIACDCLDCRPNVCAAFH
ncbi:MAG: hypothetical protein SGPRY_004561 [Prymnesium sp.]